MKDACDRDKWRKVVKSMTIQNPANPVNGEEIGSKLTDDDDVPLHVTDHSHHTSY